LYRTAPYDVSCETVANHTTYTHDIQSYLPPSGVWWKSGKDLEKSVPSLFIFKQLTLNIYIFVRREGSNMHVDRLITKKDTRHKDDDDDDDDNNNNKRTLNLIPGRTQL